MSDTMQLLECCTIGINKILYFEIQKKEKEKTLLSSSELSYYMCMQSADIIEWLHSWKKDGRNMVGKLHIAHL